MNTSTQSTQHRPVNEYIDPANDVAIAIVGATGQGIIDMTRITIENRYRPIFPTSPMIAAPMYIPSTPPLSSL